MTFIPSSVVTCPASSGAINETSIALEFHTLMRIFQIVYRQILSTLPILKSSDLKPNKLINSLFNYYLLRFRSFSVSHFRYSALVFIIEAYM